jgi:hypothetical protein
MTKQVFYRYLGTNGVIESPIHLEDIYYVRIINLTADPNMILTDGTKKVYSVKVPEEEISNWTEIPEGR